MAEVKKTIDVEKDVRGLVAEVLETDPESMIPMPILSRIWEWIR